MKKVMLYALLMMVLLTACQPTPEEIVVVGKGEEHIQEILDKSIDESDEIGDVDITIDEAQSIAQSLLNDLDIRGRTLVNMDKAVIFDENRRLISKGYEFIFMPDAGGLKGIYVNNSNLEKTNDSYAAPFPFEYIKVTVDEDGEVQYFRWDNICEIKDVVIESLELMPFDEIKSRILKGIRYSSADAVVAMNSLDYEISIDITKVN